MAPRLPLQAFSELGWYDWTLFFEYRIKPGDEPGVKVLYGELLRDYPEFE